MTVRIVLNFVKPCSFYSISSYQGTMSLVGYAVTMSVCLSTISSLPPSKYTSGPTPTWCSSSFPLEKFAGLDNQILFTLLASLCSFPYDPNHLPRFS